MLLMQVRMISSFKPRLLYVPISVEKIRKHIIYLHVHVCTLYTGFTYDKQGPHVLLIYFNDHKIHHERLTIKVFFRIKIEVDHKS